MVNVSNKHSAMTLFSHPNNIYSHQVRMVLAEKKIQYELIELDSERATMELYNYNPYGQVPTLVDRESILYNAAIIIEYLDERYPHPPLMPVYPVTRAQTRIFLYRVVKDWYSLVEKIIEQPNNDFLKKELRDTLLSSVEAVQKTNYFLSNDFSVYDCYIAPLLWRLPELGIVLDGYGSDDWKRYSDLVFESQTFKESLTNAEINKRHISLGEL